MIPLGRATAIAEAVAARLRQAAPGVTVHVAGSLRRGEELIHQVQLVVPAMSPSAAAEALAHMTDGRAVQYDAFRVALVVDRVETIVHCPPADAAGALILDLTGFDAHVEGLRSLASRNGWLLESRGLLRGAGAPAVARTEEAIYAALGLSWIPPELRAGGDEIVAAQQGTLPQLVEQSHIRGDLHMHTDWSDGRDSVDAMVSASVALGYEYIAITDHSPHSAAVRNLTAGRIERQADEIARVRERHPEITVLHGCEVDILADGSLDFSDDVLNRLDLVLASLHEHHGHSPDRLLDRYLAAMAHPSVAMITHPANRMVPSRVGYDLDYDRLFAAAADTGTLVEIDGAPSHLDMNGTLARQAAAAGATIAIDSDAHRVESLASHMSLGLTMARRGSIGPERVVNARPLDAVRRFVAAKRQRFLA